jgi:hypothetical protein
MNKFSMGITTLLMLTIGAIYILQAASDNTENVWIDAENGSFNEVRVVCIPANKALRGADSAMREEGANRKITPISKGSGQGTNLSHACYVKYFYNPEKPIYANQSCGSRRKFGQGEFDFIYSSLQQMGCGVQFVEPDMIADQVKNPLNYAVYVNSLMEAIQYLRTGAVKEYAQ